MCKTDAFSTFFRVFGVDNLDNSFWGFVENFDFFLHFCINCIACLILVLSIQITLTKNPGYYILVIIIMITIIQILCKNFLISGVIRNTSL